MLWFAYASVQLEYEKKKKEEGKRARADKQKVLEMLFSAFEKHQYYNIRDLVDITKQPVVSCPARRGLASGRTGTVPGGLAADLGRCVVFFFLPSQCAKVIISDCGIP